MTDAAIAPAPAAQTAPRHAVVWTEIPVTDLAAGMKFYEALTGNPLMLNEAGPNPMADFKTADPTGVAGHLYVGKPAPKGTGPTIHMLVGPLEAAMERCNAAGGQTMGPIITIPPGRFCYATDPDGNSLGLFESAM